MKKTLIAKSLAVVGPLVILMAAQGLDRTQSPESREAQPAVSSQPQGDPYAESFQGLTYTNAQKEAISKIRQDTDSRKALVLKSDKLDADQKNAMLTGYTRMEYESIYKVLTPEQKKLVSARIRARRAADQASQKPPAPSH